MVKIIIDERERMLYEKLSEIHSTAVPSPDSVIIKKVLDIGDISIVDDEDNNIVIIERKSLADLLASIRDGRYDEQSHRLLHSTGIHPHNIIYLIEGNLSSLKPKDRKLVHSTMTSIGHFKGMSIIRTATVSESAEFIFTFVDKYLRNLAKKLTPKYTNRPTLLAKMEENSNSTETQDVVGDVIYSVVDPSPVPAPTEQMYVDVVKKVKKDNLTPTNIGAIFLSQIPNISSVSAKAIMAKYDNSLPNLIKDLETNSGCLEGICTENAGKKRKLGSNAIKNVRLFLLGSSV